MAHGMELGLDPGHIVLDGDPGPLRKNGRGRQFSAPFYCGQTAVCIKMLLGREVGLGPGHIVVDGDPASPQVRGGHSPQLSFHVYCGQTAG